MICSSPTGVIIFIWSLVWSIFVSNDPTTDKFISKEEKMYLSRVINYVSKDKVS